MKPRTINKRLHMKARRKISSLVNQQCGKCAFCGKRIVLLSALKPYDIVHKDSRRVSWVDSSGTTQTALLATVEHIRPLSEGGNNERSNLAAACWFCNQERNKQHQRRTFRLKPVSWYFDHKGELQRVK